MKIAVLTAGFVYVGNVEKHTDGITITDTKNIRVWGTTKGLGELARCGPTKATVLDDVGVVEVPTHAIIHLITTDPSKWPK